MRPRGAPWLFARSIGPLRGRTATIAIVVLTAFPNPGAAEDGLVLQGADVDPECAANGVLGMMALTMLPGSFAGGLALETGDDQASELFVGQIGSGYTLSETFPLYVEGYLGFSRYDPRFLATGADEEGFARARWNSVTGSVGVGWDFGIAEGLTFRPVATAAVGHLVSDLKAITTVVGNRADVDLDFIDGGALSAWGVGGAATLAFERDTDAYAVALNARAAYLRLTPIDGADGLDATSLGAWGRLAVPTGAALFGMPLNYVAEAGYTYYPGQQGRSIAFNHLGQLGAGLEVAFNETGGLVTGASVIASYVVGERVSGFGVALALSW